LFDESVGEGEEWRHAVLIGVGELLASEEWVGVGREFDAGAKLLIAGRRRRRQSVILHFDDRVLCFGFGGWFGILFLHDARPLCGGLSSGSWGCLRSDSGLQLSLQLGLVFDQLEHHCLDLIELSGRS
jgi:hypothetical protein